MAFFEMLRLRLLDVFRLLVDWNPLEELGNLETRLSGTNKPELTS